MFRLDRILFGAGIASSRFLSRQVLRRSLLGLAVYAVSSRVHRAAAASYEYHGLVHRAGALFDESEFTGDENAIVDFKYSASPGSRGGSIITCRRF